MDSVSTAFELMKLELDAEVENLNSEGARLFRNSDYDRASDLVTRGRELSDFVKRIGALEQEWVSKFRPGIQVVEPPEKVEATARTILSSSKSPKTALLVRYPDGTVIAKEKAAETLVEVIKAAGMARVSALNILCNGENICSRTPSKKYRDAYTPPFYIKTHSSTAQKKRFIEQISEQLSLKLRVEII